MTQEEIKELIKEMELRVWAFERYRDLHKEVDANHGYWDGKRSEAAFIVEKLTWILNNTNYPPRRSDAVTMKTAEEFLKEKGIKDTLYDVNNPIPNNWIKGGLSALLDEYRSQPIPTSLQSDVVTAEEFIRRKIREDLRLTGGMKGLSKYLVNGENCLRWAHEYASARIAEMERELKEAKNLVRSITEFADGMKVLDGEALEILKKTARRVLSDTPTKLPRK